MDPAAYLDRIGCPGSLEPTAGTLTRLHRAHLYAVPFENLDIPLGRPIALSLPALFDKIVVRRRGGFCYELNGLFAWLLREIGFEVRMLAARVFHDGVPGPERAHMLLLVDADGPTIADVGFGESFIDPIRLVTGEHHQQDDDYRLTARDDGWGLDRRTPDAGWEPQYAFSLDARRLDDFADMCRYHQTSPDSTFTRRSVCSLPTPSGRLTLSNGRWIVTDSGRRQERAVTDVAELAALLNDHFGIDLGDEAQLEKALRP